MFGFTIPCLEENTYRIVEIAKYLRGFKELRRYCWQPEIASLFFEDEISMQAAFRMVDWIKIGTKHN